jgi:hypothetical protein
MRHFTQDNSVIEFELGSKTVVSDPCYSDIGDSCSLVLDTKPGKWLAEVDIANEYYWGRRVSALRAWTLGAAIDAQEPHDVCVDSGQMSIVDFDYYEGDNEGFGDESTFYGDACALTLTEGAVGGLLKSGRGVVSTTGYGDGDYRVVLSYDRDGLVIGIMVVFIEDESEDDDWYDDENEDEDDW